MENRRTSRWVFVGLAILVALIACMKLASIYTDYLWFVSLNYQSVFLKIFITRLVLGIIFAAFFFLFLWLNLAHARGTKGLVPYLPPASEWSPFDRARIEKFVNWGLFAAVLFVSVIAGMAAGGRVLDFLRFTGGQAFGIKDPVFQHDLSLYIFRIPFLKYCLNSVATAGVVAGVGAALVYALREEIVVHEGQLAVQGQARNHLFSLVGFVLLLKAVGYWLGTYGLLYSERGVTLGASYTDLKARLPALYVLAALAVLVALVWLIPLGARWSRERMGIGALIVLVAASFIGWSAFPNVVQRLFVRPNELAKETPYIQRNIDFTRAAFALEKVQDKPFQVSYALTSQDISNNRPTIANIRLWDHRPLRATYRQLQAIRTYYMFSGIDTDRYSIDGNLTQVMLAARELDFTSLPAEARRWVNQHLQWTHGYGLAMSPANAVTPDGRPEFLIKDIPPASTKIPTSRPEVYYGEYSADQQDQPQAAPLAGGDQTGPAPRGFPLARPSASPQQTAPEDYAIVQTKESEFDYPKGDKNVYASHTGTGGVPIGSFLRRVAFAMRFTKLDIAITSSITKDSRILFNRNVLRRASLIAPFLKFDRDPYLVVSDGALYWILDGYTVTDKYPYSQKYGGGINYIRNSVKAVINASSGSADFYVFDPDDPMIRTYQRLFPGLFKSSEQMPPGLMQHIRYPKDLFTLQAQVLTMYHMQVPRVLYNREDPWNFAEELVSSPDGNNSTSVPIEPYYMVMKVPGEQSEEFILMIPFTPFSAPGSESRRDNMIAWMVARCGPQNYGQLLLFEFSKEELIYGPKQINARIDQDPVISASFTLWGQKGSGVIRGHLLVIPIERSLLYVQPVYLQATQGAIPELEQVIVAFGDRLAMRSSLQEALQAVFGGQKVPLTAPAPQVAAPPSGPPAPQPGGAPAATTPAAPAGLEQLLSQAEDQLRRVDEANRKTQEELGALKNTLEKLREQRQQ